jgi:predicted SnoaL-like aldol condensation-catalyzing enzyme
MTGESGRSRNGTNHQYYKCNTARKHGDCKRKPIKKAYIEDKVVESIVNDLTDEKINDMATKISALSAKDGNTEVIKRLNSLLKENEIATANLVKAIETGKAVDIVTAQIEKRQIERSDLEAQLATELMIRPVLSYNDIKFFFDKLRKGDADDYSYRVILIDVLVERINLFGDDNPRIEIYCRASDQKMMYPINEPCSSFMGHLVRLAI